MGGGEKGGNRQFPGSETEAADGRWPHLAASSLSGVSPLRLRKPKCARGCWSCWNILGYSCWVVEGSRGRSSETVTWGCDFKVIRAVTFKCYQRPTVKRNSHW